MDPSGVCPKCGRSLARGDHKCLSNEEHMIYQIDDDEDSTPFLDKVVKESESFDELDSTSMKKDFSEGLEENSLNRTERECELSMKALRLPSCEKTPLISEGNPLSSPEEEESFSEENQEDEWEEISALGENFENILEFLDVDTSLYSDDSENTVSQRGNPLDGLPPESLVTDDSRNLNHRKHKSVKTAAACKRQITSKDPIKAKTDPDLRSSQQNISKATSKGDCWRLNPSSLLERNEPQNVFEEVPVAYPSGSQAGTSRTGQGRTISPLKPSPLKTFPSGKSGKNLCYKRNFKHRMPSNKQENSPKRASSALSSGSQTSPSRADHNEYSKTISPSKYWKVKIFPRDECGKTLFSKKNYKQEKSPKGASAALSSDPTWPDSSDHSRNVIEESPKELFPYSQCGKRFSSNKSYADKTLLHKHQNTLEKASADLHPSSQAISPSRRGASRHSRTESKKSPSKPSGKGLFTCDKCGKVISYKRNYQNHLYLHKNLKPYACEDCGKAFATKTYLTRHERRHTGERRYQCRVCGHRFGLFVDLNQHMYIHTGGQPFVCKRCGKTFAHQSSCSRHFRRHTN